jgi:biotin carboxylase
MVIQEKIKLAIIGANMFQNELILKAQSLGIETHVFAWQAGDIGEKTADHFYPISITDLDLLVEKCRELEIDAVASIASDLANIAVNFVGEKLGLRCNGISATKLSTDKFVMRNKLAASGLPIPFYQLVTSKDDLESGQLQLPVIVKPIDRSGSRGITKVDSTRDLESAITHAKQESFGEHVLVESFVDGREFSIEAISHEGHHHILQVTEKFTTGAPHFIEKGHIAPARLSPEERAQIHEVVSGSLTALAIRYGASHSEVKISSSGEICVIEIGSRMGGDFIGSYLVQANTGFDFVEAVLHVALGNQITVEAISDSEHETAIVWYFFSDEEFKLFKANTKLKTERIVMNEQFNGRVSSSNERLACALFKLPHGQLESFLCAHGLEK